MIRLIGLLLLFPVGAFAENVFMTDLDAQPAANQQVRIANFRDWRLECETSIDGQACILSTPAHAAEQAPAILLGTLTPDDARPIFVLTAPLGLAVQRGGVLRIDGQRLGQFGFRTCSAQGCQVVFRFEGTVASAMRRGLAAEVRFTQLDGSELGYAISLLGLSAALQMAAEELAAP